MQRTAERVLKPLSLLICSAMILALLALSACSRPESEVVSLLVTAELIQREKVPESRVKVVSVRFQNEDAATVEANISPAGTKATEPDRRLICRLERTGGRWVLKSVRESDGESGR